MANAKKALNYNVPEYIGIASDTLQGAGFEAYLVGGCVRDMLRHETPKDWDIATNASPVELQKIFEHTYYENKFGTVGVVFDETADKIEITTYRIEGAYSDSRHPDKIEFGKNIEDDLKRRDFTMNALALSLPKAERNAAKGTLIDLYDGVQDIHDGVIRAVGDPDKRFAEDALRMLRAVRFAAELNYVIARKTGEAVQKNSHTLENIAKERIRDEFIRIVMSPKPKHGIQLAHDLGILQYILPEVEEGIDVGQNQAHSYGVWEHCLRSLQATADKGWELELRLTALLHDVGKPRTKKMDKKKNDWSFHGHEVVGSKMTKMALQRLRFPDAITRDVTKLVRWHMFFSDPDLITLTAVRRMIRNVGHDRIWDLMNVRIADRIGMGRPKEEPYRFRKYQSMIEEVLRDPVSTGSLAIDGTDIMRVTKEKPGPRLGYIMHALLEDVLEDPPKNTTEYLEKRSIELSGLETEPLRKLGEMGMQKKDTEEKRQIKKIRNKFFVD